MSKEWPYGSQQSPIKIETQSSVPVVFPVDYLVVDYPNEQLTGHFNHTNHNFYFDKPPTIGFAGKKAPLERIHIHSRSEHWLDGKDLDFEIHFVHPLPDASVDPNATTGRSTHVVLGVFFRERKGASTPRAIRSLNEVIKSRISSGANRLLDDEPNVDTTINPLDFLPKNRFQFFRYEGSLTTPDQNGLFKECVSWVVYPQFIEVDPEHVKDLKEHAHETARPTQELNRRFVLRNFT